jgi:hypothetical protein
MMDAAEKRNQYSDNLTEKLAEEDQNSFEQMRQTRVMRFRPLAGLPFNCSLGRTLNSSEPQRGHRILPGVLVFTGLLQ